MQAHLMSIKLVLSSPPPSIFIHVAIPWLDHRLRIVSGSNTDNRYHNIMQAHLMSIKLVLSSPPSIFIHVAIPWLDHKLITSKNISARILCAGAICLLLRAMDLSADQRSITIDLTIWNAHTYTECPLNMSQVPA
jgi:hypothetical protein